MKNHRAFVSAFVVLAGFAVSLQPVQAWYAFIAGNSQRMQWVFGSSCNTNARPISLLRDSRHPVLYSGTAIPNVKTAWNNATGTTIVNAADLQISGNGGQMTLPYVQAFISNPTPGQVWVVWDVDGSIFNYIGVDPSSGVLGIGVPLALDKNRPQDICAGIIFMNKTLITDTNAGRYTWTLKHELGHVLGFAHSVAGGNGPAVGPFAAINHANRPIMYYQEPSVYPTAGSLNPDDTAGAQAVYGP